MKILKIILINLFALLLVLFVLDFTLFFNRCFLFSKFNNNVSREIKYSNFCDRRYFCKLNSFQNTLNGTEFRDAVVNKESKKAPILLFGCSFTYGEAIKYEECISYVLSKLTNRSVYNRGILSMGIKEAYFQSQIIYIMEEYIKQNKKYDVVDIIKNLNFNDKTKENFIKIFKDDYSREKIFENYEQIANDKEIEYVFYIFIGDHLRRLYHHLFEPTESSLRLQYRIEDKEIVLTNTFYERYRFLYIMDLIEEYYIKYNIDYDKKLLLWSKYVNETKEILKKNNKNLKFVVIKYDTYYKIDENISKYLDDDIIVINMQDLLEENIFNPKYFAEDLAHPSAVVWQEAVPKIVKMFNL